MNGFITPTDINNKLEELQKIIIKRRTSHRTSFMIDEGDLIGAKDLVNAEELDPSPINKDPNESDANLDQSDLKISTLHFSKHSSSRPPDSKSNLVFWDKGKNI